MSVACTSLAATECRELRAMLHHRKAGTVAGPADLTNAWTYVSKPQPAALFTVKSARGS